MWTDRAAWSCVTRAASCLRCHSSIAPLSPLRGTPPRRHTPLREQSMQTLCRRVILAPRRTGAWSGAITLCSGHLGRPPTPRVHRTSVAAAASAASAQRRTGCWRSCATCMPRQQRPDKGPFLGMRHCWPRRLFVSAKWPQVACCAALLASAIYSVRHRVVTSLGLVSRWGKARARAA